MSKLYCTLHKALDSNFPTRLDRILRLRNRTTRRLYYTFRPLNSTVRRRVAKRHVKFLSIANDFRLLEALTLTLTFLFIYLIKYILF